MFLVGLYSWWYGRGWRARWQRGVHRWLQTFHYFSIGQLFMTLFSPYRQISADEQGSSFAEAFQAFFDKTLSRIIGSIVRMFTIIAGIITLALQSVAEFALIALWWVLPLLPIIGALLFASGWVPSWL